MKNIEGDYQVGQSVRVGDHIVTIIEIDGDDIIFQLEDHNEAGSIKETDSENKEDFPPPRPR